MINKIYGTYRLICDICGEEAGEEFAEFCDAVDYKKVEGWESKKMHGEWVDICQECQESEGDYK